MKICELENFTWRELENFTWRELELDANELFEKMRHDNRQLPLSVIEKLQELCKELPEEIPKPKKKLSVTEGAAIITGVLSYLDKLPDISKKYTPIIQSTIEEIANFFNR